MNAISSRNLAPTASRKILDPRKVAPEAAQHAASFHADVIAAVEQAVASKPLVVVGMAQNVFVKRTKKALDQAGISYEYLEYGSYFSQWRERLAIKLWSGWATFPQVFVRGTLIGGQALTAKAIADGSLQRMLSPTPSGAPEIQA